jgi:uncharacterized protein YecE (DUF72 family)
MQVYCGVSGFSYREWKGTFYPERLPPKDMLPFYAERLRTTELNNTFYRLPEEAQFQSWAEATPPAFRFSVKAPRLVTHLRRLKGVEPALYEFLDRAALLGPKLGPLLFQLPPQFRLDGPRLEDFLGLLAEKKGFAVAFEFRHPTWYCDEVFEALRQNGAALVLGDDDELESPPLVRTASFGYVRLRKNAPYSERALDDWAEKLSRLGFDGLFAYFKHEVQGPAQALALSARFLGK